MYAHALASQEDKLSCKDGCTTYTVVLYSSFRNSLRAIRKESEVSSSMTTQEPIALRKPYRSVVDQDTTVAILIKHISQTI
ncbi:hypothetical protein V6N13_033345 [Hibiscus sabdariffa]|uniref:Uncharacterized protein n=1 Tax=Hibiscus sabdariffa TaxID=183260 RepID=A0ABR2FAX9_9ROSI